jgi:hypothetical protein
MTSPRFEQDRRVLSRGRATAAGRRSPGEALTRDRLEARGGPAHSPPTSGRTPVAVARRYQRRPMPRTSTGRIRRTRRGRRRLVFALAAIVLVSCLVVVLRRVGGPASFPIPNSAALAGLSTSERIVAIAESQVGYATDPSSSYCNKFSAYWDAGTGGCPSGERSEEWCADFAAWAWRNAGVQFTYGYLPGEINGGAVSFYEWAVANGDWHPATSGYVPSPGDVAIYGLSTDGTPSAAHVAIVTGEPPGQLGPDVVNGDGNRTGFSVVESGTDQLRINTGRSWYPLAGYVNPPASKAHPAD